jgi:tRNA(Ile2) C34 agmatinyltransferase TiaS
MTHNDDAPSLEECLAEAETTLERLEAGEENNLPSWVSVPEAIEQTTEQIEQIKFTIEQRDHQCAACGGECYPLGTLGTLRWYRCRNCGLDQHSSH